MAGFIGVSVSTVPEDYASISIFRRRGQGVTSRKDNTDFYHIKLEKNHMVAARNGINISMKLRRLEQYMGEEFYILAEAESSDTPAEFQRCPIGNTGVVAKK